MKVKEELIRKAIKKAEQSYCKMRISALGLNKNGSCVITTTNKRRFSGKGRGLHAEEQIFLVAARKNITKIIICRIGKSGRLLPIDPCERCSKLAEKLNIKIETVPIEE